MSALLRDADIGVEVTSPLVEHIEIALPANATACAFSSDGETLAFSLGDGAVATLDVAPLAGTAAFSGASDPVETTQLHRVAAVGLAPFGDGMISIGQDGRAIRFSPRNMETAELLFAFDNDWIEVLAVNEQAGLAGLAAGSRCVVLDRAGNIKADVDLGSSITGIAFDEAGGRIAASRYNGVTIISIADSKRDCDLEWKGSHTGVSWSPDGRYLVSSTQEKELHVWDLVTMQDFRIGGYPRKCHQMDWLKDGSVMACSGADVVTAWSFAGTGPAGRPPVEIGYVFGGTVCSVAASTTRRLFAGGYTTGNVLIGAPDKGEAVVALPTGGPAISCLAWSPDGRLLAAGTRQGQASLFRIADALHVR